MQVCSLIEQDRKHRADYVTADRSKSISTTAVQNVCADVVALSQAY